MTQLSMFGAASRANRSEPKRKTSAFTPAQASREAEESIAPSAAVIRMKVFRYIASQKSGATCWECEVALKMRHQTASARLVELKKLNMVQPSGEVRPTESGRNAVVYVACEERKAA